VHPVSPRCAFVKAATTGCVPSTLSNAPPAISQRIVGKSARFGGAVAVLAYALLANVNVDLNAR